jgi:hypothetical protein
MSGERLADYDPERAGGAVCPAVFSADGPARPGFYAGLWT